MPVAVYDSTACYDSVDLYDTGEVSYYFFTPPLVKDRPTFLEDSSQNQKDLWRHYELRYRGVNVWIMSDGSVVQDTSTSENSNTNMTGVYPWNVNNPATPYVRSIYIDAGVRPQVATEHDVSHSVYPVAFFSGGSSHPVTSAQVTLLTNYVAFGTGYADCLTVG
jgi:hypothetical protein